MLKQIFLYSLLLSTSAACFAEVENNQETNTTLAEIQTTTWVAGLGFTNIEQKAARNECVGRSNPDMHFNFTAQDGGLVYGGGMALYFFDDHCKFSQDVIDGWGDRGRVSSTASGLGVFAELGYSVPIEPQNVHFDLFAGVEKIWAQRSISNCSNCYSEDIDIDGGLYFKPQFKFIRESGFTITLGAKFYPDSEFEHSIFIDFGKTTNLF